MHSKFALAAAAGMLAGTILAETYTIDVPEGETRPLSDADVETINSGTVTLVRKTGLGTLVATNAATEVVEAASARVSPISTYEGDFDICEGVWLVHYNGAFGAAGGNVAVTNRGAVHVVSKLGGENRLKWTKEKFTFAGEGPDGQGSLWNDGAVDEYNLFGDYSTVTLVGDTLWRSKYRIDLRYYATLSLNGHRLKLDWQDSTAIRIAALTTSPLDMGTGTLELSRTEFRLAPAGKFTAEAGAALVVSNKSRVIFENSLPNAQDLKPIALTLDNGTICPEWTGCANVYAGNTGTNANNFTGPVTLRNTATVEGIGKGSPWTFGGPVSGTGTLSVKKARLNFGACGNTYTGRIAVDGTGVADRSMTGLRFYEGTDVPPAEKIELKNAQLYLAESDTFTLPELTVDGTAEFVGGLATNPVRRSRAASLVKAGDGELLYDAALDVTGRAVVEGGVLRLAKPKLGHPGLGEGRGIHNAAPYYQGTWNWYYANGATSWTALALGSCSTIRREGPAAAFSRAEWRYYVCPIYHGYVWNRTDADVTWDLACVLGTYAKIYIDGQPVDGTSGRWDGGMTAQSSQKTAAVTLTPGAHEISIALIDGKTRSDVTKAIPGPTIGWYTEWWPWSDRGLAYDPDGTIGSDCTDAETLTKDYIKEHFVPFRDPGDGSLFTVDDTPTAAIDQRGYHPYFADLEIRAGAALDLNGNDLAVGFVCGGGVVSNGTLTVRGGLTACAETLTVKGPVVFEAGASVRIPEKFPRRPKGGRLYTLLTSDEGVIGVPVVDATVNPNWRVESDGKSVSLVYERGLVVVIR